MSGTRAISTISRRELSSRYFFSARQGAEWNSRHSDRNITVFLSGQAKDLSASLYTMGTGSFPGVKWPGRGADNPPHLAPRLKKEQDQTSNSPWVFVTSYKVTFTFTFYLGAYYNSCIATHFTWALPDIRTSNLLNFGINRIFKISENSWNINIFYKRPSGFFADLKTQCDEVGRRIILGDDTSILGGRGCPCCGRTGSTVLGSGFNVR